MSEVPYTGTPEKGKVYEGRVIHVGNQPQKYQDKWLWPVHLRRPNDPDNSTVVKVGDFLAREATPSDKSAMAEMIGRSVSYVVISPGNGTAEKPAWVKIDQPSGNTPGLDRRDQLHIANSSVRMAADLIINNKAEGFDFKNIDELAKRIAIKIISLSQQI